MFFKRMNTRQRLPTLPFLPRAHKPNLSIYLSRLTVIESIPTQRTTARIARLEPLVQAEGVEGVLAGAAPLVGQLPVGADDGVADGALGLALEGADHVASVREEAVD